MHNSEITSRCKRRGGLALAVFGCALGVALIPGCTSMTGEKKKTADPILGEVHPQNSAPYGPVPPPPKSANETTGNKMSANTPTDPPAPPSPTSLAYLASRTKPLAGGTALAINDGVQQVENAAPVVRPIPKDPAFVNSSWVQAPGSPNAGSPNAGAPPSGSGTATPGPFTAQPSNFVDPQTELLKARGITQHRVDPQPDGTVRLIAIAPGNGGSSQVRTYDVSARDFPAAVQAVLQQIDQGK